MSARRPFPLPSDLNSKRALAPLVRSVLATAHASYTGDKNVGAVVKRLWPRDEATLALVTRAPSVPASTTTAGWAQELGQNVISELLVALGPARAARPGIRWFLDRGFGWDPPTHAP